MNINKNSSYIAFLIVLFVVIGNASAGQVYSEWRGATDSNWSRAANWSNATVPVVYDPLGGPQGASFSKAGFKGTGGTVPASPVIGVGTTVGVDQIVIGGNGTAAGGDLTLGGGTINVSEFINIGNANTNGGDSGTLTVNSGTLNMGVMLPAEGRLICGLKGQGYIVQNGGKINIKSFLTIADGNVTAPTTSKGFVSLLGGVMEISTGSGGVYLKMQGGTDVGDPNKSKITITDGQLVFDTISADLSAKLAAWINSGQIVTTKPDGTVKVTCAGGKTTVWVMGNQQKFGTYDEGGVQMKNVKLILQDCDGNDVTFALTGGGYGEMDGNDCTFSNIILHDTTAKSSLTIKTVGKTEISVGDITVGDGDDANGLKSIVAATTNLQGSITVNGSLGALTLGDATGEHTITIGEYPDANNITGVQIKFDQVSDLSIDSELPIKTLTATEWLGGSIEAPSIGSISITGKKTPLIAGDLDANVVLDTTINSVTVKGTLSGEWTCDSIKSITAPNLDGADITLSQVPNAKISALGKLTTKGTLDLSQILSTGNIGTVSVGKMQDSICFAGVTTTRDVNAEDEVLDLPNLETDINDAASATIKSITIKGIKGTGLNSFINSNIAAARITSASLYYPQYGNDGAPFGLSSGEIKTFKNKDANGTESLKNLDAPGESSKDDDMEVRIYAIPFSTVPVYPYLTWRNDPTNSVMVNWWNPEATGNSSVDYGLTSSYGSTATVTTKTNFHHVELTGLTAGATYHYRVRSSDGTVGRDNTYIVPASSPDSFSFAVYGDPRGTGTSDEPYYTRHQALCDWILAQNFDFALQTGDTVWEGASPLGMSKYWPEFFEIESNLSKSKVIMATMGNHEVQPSGYGGSENYIKFYSDAYPANGNSGSSGRVYSFDYGNAHFVNLSSYQMDLTQQGTWLASDLAAARANPDIKWIFAFMHAPMYTTATGTHANRTDETAAWGALFDQYDVDVVFAGHNHLYERSKSLKDGTVVADGEGTVYVTNGLGGAEFNNAGSGSDGLFMTTYSAQTMATCVTVDGNDVTVTSITNADEIVQDTFTLSK